MLISKFDLYKLEWLELVFKTRNKEYGAYYLRQHYAENMIRAMLITFATIAIAAIGLSFIIKPAIIERVRTTVVTIMPVPPITIIQPKKEIVPKAIKAAAAKPAAAVETKRFTEINIVDKITTEEPIKIKELTGAIGPANIKGPATTTNMGTGPGASPGGTGIDAGSGSGTGPVSTENLEVMPEPYGGSAAWAKFLQKNLKYPDEASAAGVQGRVWVSFIIEKDGHLSNIVVNHGVGFGLDEEALRVLKLAPAWKPGIQNGHPVRVQYSIPINFHISE